MEQEFILERDEAVRRPRPAPMGQRPPLPRRPPRPARVVGPFVTNMPAQPADSRPQAARGCSTLLVMDGFAPGPARLSPRHYSDLMQTALLLGRVRGSINIEIVSRAEDDATGRELGEKVRRLLSSLLGITGVRHGIKVSAAHAGDAGIEIRVCVN